jgi:hypothetical protein
VKRVYSAQNTLMVDHLKHVLDAEGIGCVVRNRHLSSAIGRLPPAECWTELWILDDAQLPLAERIVEGAFQGDDTVRRESWECPRCGERLEPQFEACWKCSTMRGAAVEEAVYGEILAADVASRRRPFSSQVQLLVVWAVMALTGWYLFRSYAKSGW